MINNPRDVVLRYKTYLHPIGGLTMNKVTLPLKLGMKGPKVADLQAALELVLDRGILPANDEGLRRELSGALQRECDRQTHCSAPRKLVTIFQEAQILEGSDQLDEATAKALNRQPDELTAVKPEFFVKRTVRFFDDSPAGGIRMSAFDRDLPNKQELRQTQTDRKGALRDPVLLRQSLKLTPQ
jgi:hypothetical protein